MQAKANTTIGAQHASFYAAATTAITTIASVASLMLGSLASTPAQAQQTMKIGLATVNDVQHEFAKLFAAQMEKTAPGKLRIQVYPSEQLGSIPRMVEGIFVALQVILGVLVIVLVLAHSGKDTGLSGAFGIGQGQFGPGGVGHELVAHGATVRWAQRGLELLTLGRGEAQQGEAPLDDVGAWGQGRGGDFHGRRWRTRRPPRRGGIPSLSAAPCRS